MPFVAEYFNDTYSLHFEQFLSFCAKYHSLYLNCKKKSKSYIVITHVISLWNPFSSHVILIYLRPVLNCGYKDMNLWTTLKLLCPFSKIIALHSCLKSVNIPCMTLEEYLLYHARLSSFGVEIKPEKSS